MNTKRRGTWRGLALRELEDFVRLPADHPYPPYVVGPAKREPEVVRGPLPKQYRSPLLAKK